MLLLGREQSLDAKNSVRTQSGQVLGVQPGSHNLKSTTSRSTRRGAELEFPSALAPVFVSWGGRAAKPGSCVPAGRASYSKGKREMVSEFLC